MAHLLNAETVSVAYPARVVLEAVSLGLDDGARIGVVGRNGDGKSTLLRVLARAQEPDSGRVTHSRGLDVGLLAQSDQLLDQQGQRGQDVASLVLGGRPDRSWAVEALARDVVGGLLGGLDAAGVGGLDAPLATLSGGQRRRVALAALLARPHDVLLLDEPTNQLDVEGVAWLAAHLDQRWPAGRGGLVVVTHDRWFLDVVCRRSWEVHGGAVEAFDGGYAAYVLARAERDRVAAATRERRDNLLRKELAWLRRGAPARTSKPRFRLDAAAALIADEPPPRDSLELTRMATTRLGKDVIDVEQATVAVGTGARRRVLLDGVTWRLAPGERVGLVGVNGSGKTTLLRLLLGRLTPDVGRVRRGKTVVAAMLSQDVAELDDVAQLRVAEAVERVRGTVTVGRRELTAGQLLERLGFPRERVWTPVEELSGGERRRLQLLRLLMASPTYCCSMNPPTTWTPTPWPHSRTPWTPGPAPWWWSPTTGTCWNGSPITRWPCSATAGCGTFPVGWRSTSSCGRSAWTAECTVLTLPLRVAPALLGRALPMPWHSVRHVRRWPGSSGCWTEWARVNGRCTR